MSLFDMPIQGSDGSTRYVLLDLISGERYAVPLYKLGIGAEGDAAVPVSSADPMPVSLASTPLPTDAATQTTLAAVLAKIIAAPSTEATLSALNGKIGTDAANTPRTTSTIVLPVQIVDSAGRSPKTDSATTAQMIVDYAHHEVHSGSHFFVKGYQDLAINNVLDFTFTTPDSAKWIHWLWDIQTESETNWLIYEGATVTNPLANAVTPLNSNRNSATASVAALRYELQATLAAANGDTNVGGATLISSGISGAGKGGAGVARRDSEIILKQNTIYCMRAIATAAGYINFDMQWYEHTSG